MITTGDKGMVGYGDIEVHVNRVLSYVLQRTDLSPTARVKLEELSTEPGCVLETDVLEKLISKKELCAYRHDGFWQHLDNERHREKISQKVKKV